MWEERRPRPMPSPAEGSWWDFSHGHVQKPPSPLCARGRQRGAWEGLGRDLGCWVVTGPALRQPPRTRQLQKPAQRQRLVWPGERLESKFPPQGVGLAWACQCSLAPSSSPAPVAPGSAGALGL